MARQSESSRDGELQRLAEAIYVEQFASRIQVTHARSGGLVAAAHWRFAHKEARSRAEAMLADLAE